MALRHLLFFFVVAILVLIASITPIPVNAQTGYPLPNFELPYYAGLGPYWSGGPHEWGAGPDVVYAELGKGSGLDFSNNGQSFAVAAMAEGDVVWASNQNLGGNLGIQVAVKHTVGGSIIRYGHLSSIWQPILDTLAAGQTYHVLPGYTLGYAGSTGTTNVHLHIEFRDGTRGCCGSGLLDGGNPLSWHSVVINGYRIHEVRPNELGIGPNGTYVSFNYDGVAVRESALANMVEYDHFSFRDYNGTIRQNVWTILPNDFVCNGTSNCELNSHSDVLFANHGDFGLGGGVLISDLTVPSNQPQPSNSTPTPQPGPTLTPTPYYGNSKVDIREDVNYQNGQYGWDSPTNGWFNVTDYMNDRTTSIELDSGWSIMIAQDINGGGQKKCFVTSIPDLSIAHYDGGAVVNDSISSVWVYQDATCGGQYLGTEPGDTVTIWADPNYWGTRYGWHDPYTGNTIDYMTNNASSIGVTPGWSAATYENPDFGGGFACFSASDPNLTDNWFGNGAWVNDNIASIKVFQDSNCGGVGTPTLSLSVQILDPVTGYVQATASWSNALFDWQVLDWNIRGETTGWQAGSGTQTVANYYPPGNYTLTLSVKGIDGQTYTVSQPVTISQPSTPTLSLELQVLDPITGYVQATASWSNAAFDWQVLDWNIRGETTGWQATSGTQVVANYYSPGTYTLTLSVKGLDGQTYTTSQIVTISPPPVPQYTLSVQLLDPSTGLVQAVINWSDASTDWHVLDWNIRGETSGWNTSSGSQTVTNYYPPGDYTLTFTVKGWDGQVYTTSVAITVPSQ